MKSLNLLFLLFTTICSIWGQMPESLEKGRLFTSDGSSLEFRSLRLQGDHYDVDGKKQSLSIATQDVLKIEKQTGNEALLWGAAFGGAALVGSLLGVNSAENTTGIEADSDSKAAIVIGLTGLGVAIGVLVGTNQKKYQTVYSAEQSSGKSRWQWALKGQPYATGITLSYNL